MLGNIMRFFFEQNYFSFNNKTYLQEDGLHGLPAIWIVIRHLYERF